MEICNCRHCGTGRRWWIRGVTSYKCPRCEKDPEKVQTDDLYGMVEKLKERVSALEREQQSMEVAAGECREKVRLLQDIACQHETLELYFGPDVDQSYRLSPAYRLYLEQWGKFRCARCKKPFEPEPFGRAELMKRIKKEG